MEAHGESLGDQDIVGCGKKEAIIISMLRELKLSSCVISNALSLYVSQGCGRGISTSWFVTHGLEYVVCAEGSHDAVTQSILPKIKNIPNGTKWEIVEHDFSRGPWWPSRTVDAVWCVEVSKKQQQQILYCMQMKDVFPTIYAFGLVSLMFVLFNA